MIDYGRTALLAFSTTLFVITGAAAQSERLLVNMPKGFCRIERQLNATESAMVYKLDGGPSAMVAIAAVYVDCPSMPLFAKGAYGDVKRWAVIATGRSETRITSRKDFVDSFANNYVIDSGELLDRLYGAVDAYTANFATNPKHGRDQPTTLGIIDRDDRAIYKASIINLTVGGRSRIYTSVNGMTVVGQTIVRLSMHAPHRRNTVYADLLGSVRRAVIDIDTTPTPSPRKP